MDKAKLDELMKIANTKYLNPLQCDMSFMHCNTFIYFIIGMIALFTMWILFFSAKYSKTSMLFMLVCLFFLFIGCSLLLLNMCMLKKPDAYNYIALGCSIFAVILVMRFFRPYTTIQQVSPVVVQQPIVPTSK